MEGEVLVVVFNSILKSITLVLILIALPYSSAFAKEGEASLPKLDKNHINILDNGHMLSQQQIDLLQIKATNLSNNGFELLIVTEPDLINKNTQQYAKRMFDGYHLGTNFIRHTNKNALLLLIDKNHINQFVLYTDTQLEPYFTKDKVHQLFDSTLKEDFQKGEYNEGLVLFMDRLPVELKQASNYALYHDVPNPKAEYQPVNKDEDTQNNKGILSLLMLLNMWAGAIALFTGAIASVVTKINGHPNIDINDIIKHAPHLRKRIVKEFKEKGKADQIKIKHILVSDYMWFVYKSKK